MWSIIKWLVWGNPEEKNNLDNKLEEFTRKCAVKKIEKFYLDCKDKKTKREIKIKNLDLAKLNFDNQSTTQSTLNSRKHKKNLRKKRKKRKREVPQFRI